MFSVHVQFMVKSLIYTSIHLDEGLHILLTLLLASD